jgi:hypothetical protein
MRLWWQSEIDDALLLSFTDASDSRYRQEGCDLFLWRNLNLEFRPSPEGVVPFTGEADFFASRRPSVTPLCLVTWYVHQGTETTTIQELSLFTS